MGFLDEVGDFLEDPLGFDLFGLLGDDDDTPSPSSQVSDYYNQNIAGMFEPAKQKAGSFLLSALGTQQDILDIVGGRFGDARQRVAEQERLGRQTIFDAQTGALGATQQAATSAGLSGSTAHASMNRGVAADTSRALSQLQAGIADIYSSLDIGQAQAEAGAMGGISSALQGLAGNEKDFLSLYLSGINQTPIVPPQESPFGDIIGGALQALPFII